ASGAHSRPVCAPQPQAPGRTPRASLQPSPFAYNLDVPAPWVVSQTLVDVGTIQGTNGQSVERHLCSPPGFDPNDPRYTSLPSGSLSGMVALVSRGTCTFA